MRTIPCDLPCAQCGYNLRGLSPENEGRCPECGHGISASVIHRRRCSSDEESEFSQGWRDYLVDTAAARSGLSGDAVYLVSVAVGRAVQVMEGRHVKAGEICVAVFHTVLEDVGRRTLEELGGLGLSEPQAVGRAVFALVEVGLVQGEAGDRIGNFDGVPTMAELWAMASRPEHDWYAMTQKEPAADR